MLVDNYGGGLALTREIGKFLECRRSPKPQEGRAFLYKGAFISYLGSE